MLSSLSRLAAATALAAVLLAIVPNVPAVAQQTDHVVGKETGLPIPRYVSIRADEANLRVGPGGLFPIRWRLLRRNMPARIEDEEGQWREIVLHDGERGWLYNPLLSGARYLYVTADQAPLARKPEAGAQVAAYVQKGVVLRATACEPGWCEVRKGEIRGWIARDAVWGVLDDERFD